jgi:fatty acid desaturase
MKSKSFEQRDLRRSRWINTRTHTWASTALTISVVGLIIVVQSTSLLISIQFAADELIAYVAMGILSHSLGVLGHECYHDSFLRSKKSNEVVGAWLFHYPLLGRFHLLKDIHLRHHRYFGTEKDPDIDHWGWQPGDRRHLFQILKLLVGVSFFRSAFGILKFRVQSQKIDTDVVAPLGGGSRIDLIGVLIAQALIAGLFAFFSSPWRYLFMWVLPIVTIGAVVEHLRVFAEHNLGKLRIFTNPTAIEKVIFSRANFRLHALHHQSPRVPWFALGSKYASVQARIGDELIESPSYLFELKKIGRLRDEI